MKRKQIHNFAIKWFEKYRDEKTIAYEVEEGFADECFALEFVMDCGHTFEEAFPESNAFYDYKQLSETIDQIDDIKLLGATIFSKWRSITHWSYMGDLLSEENRQWFIIAFERLALITSFREKVTYYYKSGTPFFVGEVFCRKKVMASDMELDEDNWIYNGDRNDIIAATGQVFYKSGVLKYEGLLKPDLYRTRVLDIVIINYNGMGTEYYESGILKYKGEFSGSDYSGYGTLYNPSGTIKYVGNWEGSDYLGNGKVYYSNGVLHFEGFWEDDKLEGRGTEYDENGILKYMGEFTKGKYEGIGIAYYDSGQIQYEGEWIGNTRSGKGKSYYKTGMIDYVGDWYEDAYSGTGKRFYQNGEIMYEGGFLKGKYNGDGKYYNDSGNLVVEGQFQNNNSTFPLGK